MKAWLRGFVFSLPVQLLFLHIRKYQVLLLFWFVLFSTVNGSFLNIFGADSLFLAPEYLGSVNAVGAAIVGVSVGMFIMSWNITTFIMFSRYFKFLSTASNPFLKYCLNNFVIPLAFVIFYFIKAWEFDRFKELIPPVEIFFLAGGFLAGLFFMMAVSFLYFFRADRNIYRRMIPVITATSGSDIHPGPLKTISETRLIRVEWYLNSPFSVHKTRDVSHYSREFIESIFKRHHFAAVLSILFAFLFLILIGFLQDSSFFQIPAAASITVFFAILIGVSGAFTYFLQSWSIPYLIGLLVILNLFYKWEIIDPRNKAYGLNYQNHNERPEYSMESLRSMIAPGNIQADSTNMIRVLENWKQKQGEEKPLLVLMNTSGGGHRSATFTMSMLQHLDSITNGDVMKKTFLITGASGGMIGATYFRELYLRKLKGENIRLQDRRYVNEISSDLLNPLFSSFVARDLISPALKFREGPYQYIKDRAYAFEMKLDENTGGRINKKLKDYRDEEFNARVPLIFFNSVISRDGRKLITSTQPVRFMMNNRYDSSLIPSIDPDVVDFGSFFKNQDPDNLRMLSVLRMNATFPVVLPNVWLPADPVLDVMDAGLRDNYGQETALRFLVFFNEWIKQNTRGVMILQLRDRPSGGWDHPYVTENITDHVTKPFFLLQNNWFKMMEYSQNDILSMYTGYSGYPVHKITFQYTTEKPEEKAALNFHLTQREKRHIMQSPGFRNNKESSLRLLQLFYPSDSTGIRQAE